MYGATVGFAPANNRFAPANNRFAPANNRFAPANNRFAPANTASLPRTTASQTRPNPNQTGNVPSINTRRSTVRMSVWPVKAIVMSSSFLINSSALVTPASPMAPRP